MRNSILTLLIAGTVTLAGCGGGGGGNVRPSGDGFAPRTVNDAYSADPGRTRTAAARVASSLPRFGSVTQSTNRGVSGVTTDAASTTFDGRNLSLTVSRQDGSSLRFNSATDTVPGYSTIGQSPIAGHTAVVSRFVSWNPLGNSPVCSVDGLPGMTEQYGKRLESVPASLS